MIKYIFASLLIVILFTGTDCKDEPPTKEDPPKPDTTSHNFTFTTYTFGGNGGSSYFKDVAIINDSDVWAVGAIYTDSGTYNAAHWNGKKWDLLRVPSIGSVQFPPLQAIWVIAENNILLSWGGGVITFNGNNFTDDMRMNSLLTGAINKIFALNSQNIYCVGNDGSIVHYNGTNWAKQTSGTTVSLRDVWGSTDGKTVWVCGYSNDNTKSILLKHDGTSWKEIWKSVNLTSAPYGDLLSSIWLYQEKLYAVSNTGIYVSELGDTSMTKKQPVTLQRFPGSIRGRAINDIVVGCDDGIIWHYNGVSWIQIHAQEPNRVTYASAVSKTSLIVIGVDHNSFLGNALIYMGHRN